MAIVVTVLGWIAIVGVVAWWSRGERQRLEAEEAIRQVMDS